jgi:hypothetical protein
MNLQLFFNCAAEERVIKAYLKYHGWAQGLTQTFLRNASKAPVRYVITDCSETMLKRQARYVVKSKGGWRLV